MFVECVGKIGRVDEGIDLFLTFFAKPYFDRQLIKSVKDKEAIN